MRQDNKSYYDEFSNWYENQRHKGYHALIDDLQFELVEEDARDKDVLEIGCGTGLILQRVDAIAHSAKGVDISPGMLELARQRNLDVTEGLATLLPFDDNSFDLVYSFKVLAHVREIETALQEAVRVTRPGGIITLDFYNRRSLRFLVKRLAGPQMISEKTDEGALYTRWDTPQDILDRLPENVEVLDTYGVRVLTPYAGLYKWPVVSNLLEAGERFAMNHHPLASFGGFFVVKMRRQ